MRIGAFLDVVSAAARAAFPDRAEKLQRVVERRLWFDPVHAPEAIVAGEDREIAPSGMRECASCHRERFLDEHAVMGVGGGWEMFEDHRYWSVHVVEGTLRLPILLCGVCRLLAADDPAGDDAALHDLARALDAAERSDVRAELERRFSRAVLPAVSSSPCACCSTRMTEPPHPGPICNDCWRKARAATPGEKR